VAIGLACASKYTAAFAAPALLLLVAADGRLGAAARARRIACAVLVAIAAFLLATPYALLDLTSFRAELDIVRSHYTQGHLGAEGSSNWGWYVSRLRDDGLGIAGMTLLAIGAAGVVADMIGAMRDVQRASSDGVRDAARARLRGALFAFVVLGAALAWFAWLGHVRVRFERNLMPSVVLACAAAGHGLGVVLRLARERASTFGWLVALVVLLPLYTGPISKSRDVVARLTAEDTRTVAAQWVENHVDKGTSIVREEYTPQLDGMRYRVEYQWSLASRDPSEYLARGTQVLIASQSVFGRFVNNPHAEPEMLDRYKRMFLLPKLASFAPGPGMSGPVIHVFDVRAAAADKKPGIAKKERS
jgi:hypothetical protein